MQQYINLLNSIDTTKPQEGLTSLTESMGKAITDIQNQTNEFKKAFGEMSTTINTAIPKDNLTNSLDGIRDALNNFNRALTGASIDNETNKMKKASKSALADVTSDLQKLTTSVQEFPDKMQKVKISEEQSTRIEAGATAFEKLATALDKLKQSSEGLDAVKNAIGQTIAETHKSKEDTYQATEYLTNKPEMTSGDKVTKKIEEKTVKDVSDIATKMDKAASALQKAVDALNNDEAFSKAVTQFETLKTKIKECQTEIKKLKTELDNALGDASPAATLTAMSNVVKAYTNVENAFNNIKVDVNKDDTTKFGPMINTLNSIRNKLRDPIKIKVDLTEINASTENLGKIAEALGKIRESLNDIDPNEVQALIRGTTAGNEAKELYEDAERTIKRIASLQKEMGNASFGTDYWNELYKRLNDAQTRYEQIRERIEK